MMWTPLKVTDGVPAYNTLTYSWAASAARTYATRAGNSLGTTSTVAPASAAELLKFDVPSGADLFAIEIVSQRISGASTVTWVTTGGGQKLEAYVESIAGDTGDFTFGADNGRTEEPFMWLPGAISGANPVATTHVINRGYVDIGTGPDVPIVGATNPLVREGGASTAIKRSLMFFSPYGAVVGTPYVAPYKRIYLTLSLTPNASVTAAYTVKFRPIAIRLNDSQGLSQ